jgi:hypothetical protein
MTRLSASTPPSPRIKVGNPVALRSVSCAIQFLNATSAADLASDGQDFPRLGRKRREKHFRRHLSKN